MFHSGFLNGDPRWFQPYSPRARAIPAGIKDWLGESSSLTARLKQGAGDIRVEVRMQGWGRPFLSESRLLGILWGRLGWVREIVLSGGGKPLLLARTVAPRETLETAGRRFSRLGTRPLGEILFTCPGIERHLLEWAWLPAGIWREADSWDRPCWGRRTLYRIGGRPLLVGEYFMPAAFKLEDNHG